MALSNSGLATASIVLNYLSPVLIAVYFISVALVSFIRLEKSKKEPSRFQRNGVLAIQTVICLSYVVELAMILGRSKEGHEYLSSRDNVIHLMSNVLLWACLAWATLDTPSPIWHHYVGTWAFAAIFEVTVCVLQNLQHPLNRPFNDARLALQAVRVFLMLAAVVDGSWLAISAAKGDPKKDEESQPLLSDPANGHIPDTTNGTAYGTTPEANGTAKPPGSSGSSEDGEDKEDEDDKAVKELQRKRLEEQGGWLGYMNEFAIFLPHLWPSKDRVLQLFIAGKIFFILIDRALNVLTPRQVGIITNKLAENWGTGKMPWADIGLWLFYGWVTSNAGLGMFDSYMTLCIQQFSYRSLTNLAFQHVLNLSMKFHDDKDSGEVVKAVEQGNSINELIELVVFDTGPMIIDLVVALIYVSYLFDAYFAFTIFVVGLSYFWLAIKSNDFINPLRRKYAETHRNESKISYESVSNWQTVAYFNRVAYEQGRLGGAIDGALKSERAYTIASRLMYGLQQLIMTLGLAVLSISAASYIVNGDKPVGSFVILITYWSELSYPLWMLAYSYRHLASNLIDAERLLQLLQTKPSVQDKPGAKPITITGGEVEFKDVQFSYDPRKPTLSNVSFKALAGQTIAFVGETGSGKSTTLKLLFRFYDVTSGSITIDGQDIRNVTLGSLRDSMGVVPQDASLFNTSVLENVRYARLDATDEEVAEACKAAAIHDKIMTFPDEYKTKVGERGVKLSGGELQRVSIARVLLKNPQIVLLDEATSAVDSSTEAQIQDAFRELSKGRTTFVIAHRLSTIMDADCILVVDAGKIVERGRHEELLEKGGKYKQLWEKQTKKVVEEAEKKADLIDLSGDEEDKKESGKEKGKEQEPSLLDQVDGQSEIKATGRERSGSSATVKRALEGLKERFQGKKDDDEAPEGSTEGGADEGPLKEVSPRPTGGLDDDKTKK